MRIVTMLRISTFPHTWHMNCSWWPIISTLEFCLKLNFKSIPVMLEFFSTTDCQDILTDALAAPLVSAESWARLGEDPQCLIENSAKRLHLTAEKIRKVSWGWEEPSEALPIPFDSLEAASIVLTSCFECILVIFFFLTNLVEYPLITIPLSIFTVMDGMQRRMLLT